MISNRFGSNIIASANLNKALIPGLAAPNADGPIVSGADLKTIANSVYVDLAKAPNRASHARPAMMAFLSGFVRNVLTALDKLTPGKPVAEYTALDAQVKRDFAQWQGLTAAVALNGIYSSVGLSLSVMSVPLVSTRLIDRCVLMEMDRDPFYHQAVQRDKMGNLVSGILFYICQKGTPFALYHPGIGIVPMHTFDPTAFRGILPWYVAQDCHKGWQFIAEPGGEVTLDDIFLSRIAWWANKNHLLNYGPYITGRQKDAACQAPAELASSVYIPGADQINNVWADAGTYFSSTILFSQDAAGMPCSLPEVFCEKLLISSMGEGNQMVYNTPAGTVPVCFSVPGLSKYVPVPPLTVDAMDLLTRCSLIALSFDADLQNNVKLRAVTVCATLRNPQGETFTVKSVFGSGKLLLGCLPYLMLWPFVDMPDGPGCPNPWKQYYATWIDQTGGIYQEDGGLSIVGMPLVSEISFDFEDQGHAYEVADASQNTCWTVCCGDRAFRYAKVTGKIEDEVLPNLGVVIMPQYPTYDPSLDDCKLTATPVKVGVDFGTTSTVCALTSPLLPAGTQILTYQDYGRAVTCDDVKAKQALDEGRWLGRSGEDGWTMNSKIFTVAQLFNRTKEVGPNWGAVGGLISQEYYVDSRMFLISGQAMVAYSAANTGKKDPLRDQQILNDIKFDDTLDPKNYHAASAFLAGIYIHVVLFLLKNKIVPGAGGYLELRASYPNTTTLAALRTSWINAKKIADQLMTPNLTAPIQDLCSNDQFYTEAAATTAYQRSTFGGMIAAVPTVVSVDIGGGTTDISITNAARVGDVRNMSLRYAGREMMVTTLVEYFRRFSKGAANAVDCKGTFKALWNADEGSNQMQSLFFALCKNANTPDELKNLSKNNSIRMIVEMLLAGGMTLSNDLGVRLLRQLIALKFIMVIRLTARVVWHNFDIWKLPDDLVGGKLPINLAISGTSAQLLQYVFHCEMIELGNANVNSPNPDVASCVKLFTKLFESELKDKLPEGVGVDLQFYVRPNVSDKREVAFGMLEDNENPFAPKSLREVVTAKEVDIDEFADPNAEKQKQARATDEIKARLMTFPHDKLEEYLKGSHGKYGIIPYLVTYEKLFPVGIVGSDLGFGMANNSISALLNSFDGNLESQARFTAANSFAKYMIEEAQKPYETELACTYLIEDMIDRAMAQFQAN